MGEVVSLRLARKAKARSDKEAAAEANRLAHGRSKAEKNKTKAERQKLARDLDAQKIERD